MPVDNGFYLSNAILACCQLTGQGGPVLVRLATPVIIFTNVTAAGFVVDWQDVTDANRYDIDIATDSGFSNIIRQGVNLTSSTYTATDLTAGTNYFVRVVAKGNPANNVDSNYGTASTSTTAALQAPTLSAQRGANSILTIFNNPVGAQNIVIQDSSSNTFPATSATNQNSEPASIFSHEIGGVAPATIRYIRVKATAAGMSDSAWSATVQITTFNTALAVGGTVAAGGITLSGAATLQFHFNTLSNPASPNASQDDFVIAGTNRGNIAFPDDYVGQDCYISYAGTSYYGPTASAQYKFLMGQPATITIA